MMEVLSGSNHCEKISSQTNFKNSSKGMEPLIEEDENMISSNENDHHHQSESNNMKNSLSSSTSSIENTEEVKIPALDKYNLRTKSIQNRIEVEKRKREPRKPKPKQRPPPLSKYRRKTANLRERCRMQVRKC